MRRAFFLTVCFAAACGLRAAPWDASRDFVAVSPDGSALEAGGKRAIFSCADLGGFVPKDAPDAARFAERLWACGFDSVRIDSLTAPYGEDPISGGGNPAADAFVAACRALRLRVWAEVADPGAARVQPSAVSLVDDPSTAAEWAAAVSEAAQSPSGASALALASAWDPRLEVARQRRVRAWGRAFNEYTGLRRCEDPAFFAFSFSSHWLDAMAAPDRAPLPKFFEDSLRVAWNNWLYEKYRSDSRLSTALGALAPGESLDANSVGFPPIDPANAARSGAFRRAQLRFLEDLVSEHLKRVVEPFSLLGPTVRGAPKIVFGGSSWLVEGLSSMRPHDAAKGDKPSFMRCAAERLGGEAAADAALAASGGVSVFLVPVRGGTGLNAAADAAALFRAGCSGVSVAPGETGGGDGELALDLPKYARAEGVLAIPDGTNEVSHTVAFPQFGAELRFVAGAGSSALDSMKDATDSTNAAPAIFVVHVRASESRRNFAWRFLGSIDERTDSMALTVEIENPGADEPCDFGFIAGGSALARRSLVPLEGFSGVCADEAGGEMQPALPDGGVFVHQFSEGRADVVFRPAVVTPATLRAP